MIYHIYNPSAGKGLAGKEMPHKSGNGITVHETRRPGDATTYTHEVCVAAKQSGDTPHIHIWGGDGSIGECANGIITADAGDIATLTAHPCGTGNDFVRYFGEEEKNKPRKIDVMRLSFPTEGKETVYHGINMVNIGFDCSVVTKTAEVKKWPLVSGSLAYILGVLGVLFRPLGRKMKITWEDEKGAVHELEDMFLLCAVANASYCGGGFRVAPCASLTDGMLDVLLVRVISRFSFIRLVGAYHDGTHILPDGTPNPKFSKIMRYIKCKKLTVDGMEAVCIDGEVKPTYKTEISVLPKAILYRPE